MKKIINLIFDRIERVLWFRHLLWTLRKFDNDPYFDKFNPKTEDYGPEREDYMSQNCIDWLRKHRNDYLLNFVCRGSATSTENSADVNEDEP